MTTRSTTITGFSATETALYYLHRSKCQLVDIDYLAGLEFLL